MSRRNWKHVQPRSLRHAMELCLDYARERKRLSVDRVADLMGLANKFTLYKWLASGRMPASLIPPFEHACGVHFVSGYLAYAAHRLVIEIPNGKPADATEINELQRSMTEAVGLLIDFYQGKAGEDETLAALRGTMQGIAWHERNVAAFHEPELPIFEEGRP